MKRDELGSGIEKDSPQSFEVQGANGTRYYLFQSSFGNRLQDDPSTWDSTKAQLEEVFRTHANMPVIIVTQLDSQDLRYSTVPEVMIDNKVTEAKLLNPYFGWQGTEDIAVAAISVAALVAALGEILPVTELLEASQIERRQIVIKGAMAGLFVACVGALASIGAINLGHSENSANRGLFRSQVNDVTSNKGVLVLIDSEGITENISLKDMAAALRSQKPINGIGLGASIQVYNYKPVTF